MAKRKTKRLKKPRSAPPQRKYTPRMAESDYLDDLDQEVNELFAKAALLGWSWRDIARNARLSYGTVQRLGFYQTRFPEHRSVSRIRKAVTLGEELEQKFDKRKNEKHKPKKKKGKK